MSEEKHAKEEAPSANGRPIFEYKQRKQKLYFNEQTLNILFQHAAHQHSKTETAALLGIHVDTLHRFLRENEDAKAAWEDGKSTGMATVRRMVISHARDDAPTARWLAERMLGINKKMDKAKAKIASKAVGEALEGLEDKRMISSADAEQRIIELQRKLRPDTSKEEVVVQ